MKHGISDSDYDFHNGLNIYDDSFLLKVNRLLASTLALVLVAGLASPAFAQTEIVNAPSGPMTPNQISNIQSAHNIVFDNGGAPDANSGFLYTIHIPSGSPLTLAEDFVINTDTFVTDFHFVSVGEPSIIEYGIYSDGGLHPGTELVSGTAQKLDTNSLGGGFFEVWFNLEDPFLAEAGVKFWFSIHTPVQTNDFGWVWSNSGGFGEKFAGAFAIPINNWNPADNDLWFLLSGNDVVVGGEFLPIDSTALLLAGAQTNAVWIMSALAVIGSVTFGALYITTKKN